MLGDLIFQVSGAFAAVICFSVLLETPREYLLSTGIVGGIGWIVYFLVHYFTGQVVLANFLAAVAIAFVSHIFARTFKAPVTVFFIAGILPLVPGGTIYNAVYQFLHGNKAAGGDYLMLTLEIAGVLAMAIFIVDTVFQNISGEKQRILGRRKNRKTAASDRKS